MAENILITLVFFIILIVLFAIVMGLIFGIIDIEVVPPAKYNCTFADPNIYPFPLACKECTYYRRLK